MAKAKALPILFVLHYKGGKILRDCPPPGVEEKALRSPRRVKEGGIGPREATMVKD